MRPGRRRWLSMGIALLLLAASLLTPQPPAALAHPLGNFTVNRYSRIELAPSGVHVRYVVDMAEIPAFQEMAAIDSDQDGQVSAAEHERYLEQKSEELRRGLRLSINGVTVPLRPLERELEFPPGQGGLATLRLGLLLFGDMPRLKGQTGQRLDYEDTNYAERLGWKEIVVRAGDGVLLLASSVPQEDRSEELRSYPQDLLSSAPSDTQAYATFAVMRPASAGVGQPLAEAREGPKASPARKDTFTDLVSAERLSLPVVVLSLLAAIVLGALHAISPGHGKTIMAAYLVGTRGTALHAVFLGLTVTVSHTLGVLALGLVTLYASHLIAPEQLYPWLGLASGAIIIGIGLWLLASRLREGRHGLAHATEAADWAGLAGHPHTHAGDPGHSHPHSHAGGNALHITWRNLTALGVAGGLLPSTSALVMLLAAISLDRVGFGVLLIVAFSAGMAGVLSGAGLLLVYAGRAVERFSPQGRLVQRGARLLPLATALVVLASGLFIAVRAALQMGLL